MTKPVSAGRRETDHRQASHQLYSNQASAGPGYYGILGLLQREALFGIQLLLAFSIAYTTVQLTRNFIISSGFLPNPASSYAARVFWPTPNLAFLPKPVAPQTVQTHKAKPSLKITHSNLAQGGKAQQPVRLQSQPFQQANAYRWAPPLSSHNTLIKAYKPSSKVVTSKYPRSARPVKLASSQAKAKLSQPVQKIQQILKKDYKVSKLKSYDEYMSWVRKTLKDYKGG